MSFNPYHAYVDLEALSQSWELADSPARAAFIFGFRSVETALRLVGVTRHDARPTARCEERVDALLNSVPPQLELIGSIIGASPDDLRPTGRQGPARSDNLGQLSALGTAHTRVLRRITDAFFEPFEELPYGHGLEAGVNELRAGLGQARRRSPVASLDYEDYVQPLLIARLGEGHRYGPEDPLFSGVHQMTECWLRVLIAMLEAAHSALREGAWSPTRSLLRRAARIFEFLAVNLHVLDTMVLEDYHPLRVALKGSSGAQSAAAADALRLARGLIEPALRQLERTGLTPLNVFRAPKAHLEAFLLLEEFWTFESSLAAFFFHHYGRAVKVQTARGLGALGQGLEPLTRRFLQPLYPELDEARFDHLVVSNHRFAPEQGKLVFNASRGETALTNELAGPEPESAPSLEGGQQVARALIRALEGGDDARFAALFEPNGQVQDLAGTRPYRGPSELESYFRGVRQTYARLRIEPLEIRTRGGGLDLRFRAEAVSYREQPVSFHGRYWFRLGPSGSIRELRADWDPNEVVPQLLPGDCRSRGRAHADSAAVEST